MNIDLLIEYMNNWLLSFYYPRQLSDLLFVINGYTYQVFIYTSTKIYTGYPVCKWGTEMQENYKLYKVNI